MNKRGWLVFYHHKLEEIGDTDIMNATYTTLPPDVFAMSGDSTSISDALTPNKSAWSGGRKEKEAKERLTSTRTVAIVIYIHKSIVSSLHYYYFNNFL